MISATSNIPKITSQMNDYARNDRVSVVSETYDFLHNHGDYIQNGTSYTIPRPSSSATLREVRIRRFNPITKRGRDNYENLALNIKVLPYIVRDFEGATYYPNHQLYINGSPYVTREYTAKFGNTKENTTRNINDCINASIPNVPNSETPAIIEFYNPSDPDPAVFVAKLEPGTIYSSVEYSGDGVTVHIQPITLKHGSDQLFLIFNLYITTTDWFVFNVTPEDIITAWKNNGGGGAAFSSLVGHYIGNYSEAYDIIKSVARGDRLVLKCDSMNNRSGRVYVEGDSSEPIIYKFVDAQPSQPYITVSIKTLREEIGEKKAGDYLLEPEMLANLYDAIIVDLDWIFERL